MTPPGKPNFASLPKACGGPPRVWSRIARCVGLDAAGRVSVGQLGPNRNTVDAAYLRLLCEEHRSRDDDGQWAIRWPAVQFEYEVATSCEIAPDLTDAFPPDAGNAWDTVLQNPDVAISIDVCVSGEARAIIGDAGAGFLERIAERHLEGAFDLELGMSGTWSEIRREYEREARKHNLPIPGEPPRGLPKGPTDRHAPRLPF